MPNSKSEGEASETENEQAHPSSDDNIFDGSPPAPEPPPRETAPPDPVFAETFTSDSSSTVDSAHPAEPASTGQSTPPLSANPELDPCIGQPTGNLKGRRIRKTRVIDLKGCECGLEVSQAEIDAGESVMMCKVPGCETVWVS